MKLSVDKSHIDKTEEEPQDKLSRGETALLSFVMGTLFFILFIILSPYLGMLGFLAFSVPLFIFSGFIVSRSGKLVLPCLITVILWLVLTLVFVGNKYNTEREAFSQAFNVPEESITNSSERQQDKQVYYKRSGEEGALRLATFVDDKIQYEYYSFELGTKPGSNPYGYANPKEYAIKNVTPITEKEAFEQGVFSHANLESTK